MGKTVLIVEDEQSIVDILSFNLTKEGYDTWRPWMAPRACSWPWSRTRTWCCWT